MDTSTHSALPGRIPDHRRTPLGQLAGQPAEARAQCGEGEFNSSI